MEFGGPPPPELSGSAIVEKALVEVLATLDTQEVRTLRGLRPDLATSPKRLKELLPVAKALVGRELRSVGAAIIRRFEILGRLVDSDSDWTRAARSGDLPT
jgi:hypothetical protein